VAKACEFEEVMTTSLKKKPVVGGHYVDRFTCETDTQQISRIEGIIKKVWGSSVKR
jgi:hypothetical protein